MIVTPADVSTKERLIYNQMLEKGFGWDLAGELLVTERGTAHQITWSNAEMNMMYKGWLTHNHPRPSFTAPSWLDLDFMHNASLRQMRTCGLDFFLWHKVAHRTVSHMGSVLPAWTLQYYTDTLTTYFKSHGVPYTINPKTYSVVPNEVRKYSIDALDAALTLLGKDWDFVYEAWTD